jgi:hypothetical protein
MTRRRRSGEVRGLRRDVHAGPAEAGERLLGIAAVRGQQWAHLAVVGEGEERRDFEGHPAVDAVGRVLTRPEEVGGLSEVLDRELEEELLA